MVTAALDTRTPATPDGRDIHRTDAEVLDRARAAAARVTDPEMPMLTLVDLGVLRDVTI